MTDSDQAQALNRYIEVLQQLQAHNLNSLTELLAADVVFKDPFNLSDTREQFIAIMADMFGKLSEVRFTVHEHMQEGERAYIFWTYYGASKLLGEFEFEGVSKLKFNAQGLVTEHYDLWDGSQLMQQLPLVGLPVRFLRGKFKHG